jgi:hypothetical protein
MTTSASSDEGTTTHDDDDDGEETVAELQVCGDSSNSMEVDEASAASSANAVSDQNHDQSRVMTSRHAVAAATMAERSRPISNGISLRGWTIIGPPAGHVYW